MKFIVDEGHHVEHEKVPIRSLPTIELTKLVRMCITEKNESLVCNALQLS